MHKDGRQDVKGSETLFTLLVYLNDNYRGGETKFRQDKLEVHPQRGSALLFEHHLWHQGAELIEGTKYILRTDVVYSS